MELLTRHDTKAMEVVELSVPEIIAHIQEHYIEPARSRGEKQVVIRAGDIHSEMKLKDRQPLVCDTLRGNRLLMQCGLKLVEERRGRNVHQKHAGNIWYRYELKY